MKLPDVPSGAFFGEVLHKGRGEPWPSAARYRPDASPNGVVAGRAIFFVRTGVRPQTWIQSGRWLLEINGTDAAAVNNPKCRRTSLVVIRIDALSERCASGT